jgi:hypothetical protein
LGSQARVVRLQLQRQRMDIARALTTMGWNGFALLPDFPYIFLK